MSAAAPVQLFATYVGLGYSAVRCATRCCKRIGSASVSKKIERENLFAVPLDTSRHGIAITSCSESSAWRAELRRTEPDLVADLHRRAATWFETRASSMRRRAIWSLAIRSALRAMSPPATRWRTA